MDSTFIWGIIRHLLTALAGVLATSGYLSADQVSQAVGAIMFIAMLIGSIYSKLKAKKALDVALELPPGTSKETLKKELNLR